LMILKNWIRLLQLLQRKKKIEKLKRNLKIWVIHKK